MTAIITTAFPSSRGAAYKACELIIARGPQTVEQLLIGVDFGAHNTQKAKIRAAIEAGWMFETPAGTLDVTESVRQHFADIAPKPKKALVGEPTAPAYRGNVFGSALNKRYIPDRRGPRADVPDRSSRETVTAMAIGRRES